MATPSASPSISAATSPAGLNLQGGVGKLAKLRGQRGPVEDSQGRPCSRCRVASSTRQTLVDSDTELSDAQGPLCHVEKSGKLDGNVHQSLPGVVRHN
jgi:hypothetical protein